MAKAYVQVRFHYPSVVGDNVPIDLKDGETVNQAVARMFDRGWFHALGISDSYEELRPCSYTLVDTVPIAP